MGFNSNQQMGSRGFTPAPPLPPAEQAAYDAGWRQVREVRAQNTIVIDAQWDYPQPAPLPPISFGDRMVAGAVGALVSTVIPGISSGWGFGLGMIAQSAARSEMQRR